MTAEQNAVPTNQGSLKHVAFHEAAHAVIGWNFGFVVLRVVVNRADRSGYVLPYGYPAHGPEPVGNILLLLAGGVAHRCYASGIGKQEVHCSEEDYRLALKQITGMFELPSGAEFLVMGYFMNRTRELIDTPEIKAQVQAIANAVLRTEVLTKWQLQKILTQLPASTEAKKQCRAMKLRIEAELERVVEKAVADAARIAAMPGYEEVAALMRLKKPK